MLKLMALFMFIPFASMAGSLEDAMVQSAAGLKVQSARMKVISQNIANVDSTGSTPGEEPYRRKTITFKNRHDKERGVDVVTVDKLGKDNKSPLNAKFEPSHPAADKDGYVLLPNVSTPLETVDMKESQRSYEANLGAMETTKRMFMSTVDLLR